MFKLRSESRQKFCILQIVGLLLGATVAFSNTDLDRRYSLETVGFLKSTDNVDGLFVEYVASAYKNYFSNQSRFVLQDISRVDTVLDKSKTPYAKLIHDREILVQVARSARSESMIRTHIQKEGKQYRFTLEWLHAPEIDILATESFVLQEQALGSEEAGGLGDVPAALEKGMEALIKKLPFLGNVTGRDNDSVTINLGASSGVKPGDIISVSTLDEVKKHPLLKTIVEWRLNPVGRLQVEVVDERISFCKVIEEEPNRKIARYQKIVQLFHAPEKPIVVEATEVPLQTKEEPRPRLGWVSGGVGLGSFSRQYTASGLTPSSFTGSGFHLGPKAEVELWLTNNWFFETGFDYGFWSYSQKDDSGAETAAGEVSARFSKFRVDAGYSFFKMGNLEGPKGWIRAGFQSANYTFPDTASEGTAPISFGALFFGLGGELPVRGAWSAVLNIDFGLFPSATLSGANAQAADSASFVGVCLGAAFHYSPQMMIRLGIDIQSHGATLANGTTISNKIFSVIPALQYYF